MATITAIPAYGRDYKSRAALLHDWEAGNDFLIRSMNSPHDGRYFSIRDTKALLREGITHIQFRHGRLTKVFLHPLTKEGE